MELGDNKLLYLLVIYQFHCYMLLSDIYNMSDKIS